LLERCLRTRRPTSIFWILNQDGALPSSNRCLMIRSALHRALYHGRISCAQYILTTRGRDTIKLKDRESNSPFDVLNSTLTGTNPPPFYGEYGGSDLYTFGSNKNNNLGFGDGDDRGHPERVQIIRPPKKDEIALSAFRPSRIRDVQMAKMHTAIITADHRDNLYMCGFNGSTGRLAVCRCNFIDGRLGLSATASTGTQFLPKQVHGINEQVISVALGQDHTMVITKSGAVYTWGSNRHGQLGYSLDLSLNKDNVQRLPRRIVATLKRIEIIGVAASSIHSVCFSTEDLYTWGLNRGQLGYSAGDEGPIQLTPKKIASLPYPVEMATAIDNATICLLKNKTVVIFANGGYFRVKYDSWSTFSNGKFPIRSIFRRICRCIFLIRFSSKADVCTKYHNESRIRRLNNLCHVLHGRRLLFLHPFRINCFHETH